MLVEPDARLGIGLRLEETTPHRPTAGSTGSGEARGGGGGGVVAVAFKRDPATGGVLPAERTGRIGLGHLLVRVNGQPLPPGTTLKEVGETKTFLVRPPLKAQAA